MRVSLPGLALAAALIAAGWFMPKWLTFLITMAAANGMVSLGIVMLMRSGVVPFGQGMVFAIGGYTAALGFNELGVTDALLLALAGGVAGTLIAAPFAPLLARYRGIFFAMLTLALSMVVYGLLAKTTALGGTDGFNMGRPTVLGMQLPDARVGYAMYAVTLGVAAVLALLTRRYFDSVRGLLALAVRDNELRVEYLGGSVRKAVAVNYVLAAFVGGVGGGDHRTEALAESLRAEHRPRGRGACRVCHARAHCPGRFIHSEPMPRGRKRMTNSRNRPSANCQVLGK